MLLNMTFMHLDFVHVMLFVLIYVVGKYSSRE